MLPVDAADLRRQLVLGLGPGLSGGPRGEPLVVTLPTLHRQDTAQPRDAAMPPLISRFTLPRSSCQIT